MTTNVRGTFHTDAFASWMEEPTRIIVLHETKDPNVLVLNARKIGFTSSQGQRYDCYLPGREGRSLVKDMEMSWSKHQPQTKPLETSVPLETSTTLDETKTISKVDKTIPGEEMVPEETYESTREEHGRT